MTVIKQITIIAVLFLILSMNAFSQINTEIYRSSMDEDGIKGKINFSYAHYTGNADLKLLKGGFRLDHLKKSYNTFLVANLDYGESDGISNLSKGFSHLRSIRKLNQMFSGELFVQKQYDKFIYLKNRDLLGGGLRISSNFKSREEGPALKVNFNLGIGLMYEHEKYDREDEEFPADLIENTYVTRSTNYISMNAVYNEKIKLNLIGYYQVDIEDFNNYRILTEGNLEIPLYKNLSFSINASFRYDNHPFSDLKRHDFQLTNGLSYSF